MRLKFFAVPAADSADAEREVNAFLASKRILAIDRQLVTANGTYWALAITYDEGDSGRAPIKRGRIDYKEVLSEPDFAVFSRLGFRLARAQTRPGWAASDPAVVRCARSLAGTEHPIGRRCASRALDGAAKARRRPDSCLGPR